MTLHVLKEVAGLGLVTAVFFFYRGSLWGAVHGYGINTFLSILAYCAIFIVAFIVFEFIWNRQQCMQLYQYVFSGKKVNYS
jgi:ABC-type Fe3+-siderophore transport system permease subunit